MTSADNNSKEPAAAPQPRLLNSAGAVLNSHAYEYDFLNRRICQIRTDGSYVDYTYDDLGQLISASGKEPGGTTNRWQEQFNYVYDKAGNLLYRTNHTLAQAFGVNDLNQLTNQSRSGRMSVAGTTSCAATNVTVNTTNAIRYADNTFVSTNHTLSNGTNTFTAIGKDNLGRIDTNIVTAYLPTNSVFVYDSNGNMVYDGQKAFAYDDENQLIQITATNAWKSEFTYDGKMRRRIRKEYTWRSSAWTLTNEAHYIYDGNLVIQERDYNNLAQVTYTRGKDLSGSLEGAGGIGGLLARTDNGQLTTSSSQAHAYYHADGNGNVTTLINTLQTVVARYMYDSFGIIAALSGALADANAYRFSSRESHQNSGLTHYLHRYYSPNLQRWLNRDPIEEDGGINLYGFVLNNPIGDIDPFGTDLRPPRCCRPKTTRVCTPIGIGILICVDVIIQICEENDRAKCHEDCHKAADDGEDECRKKPTPKLKAICWKKLYDDLAKCIQECNRRYPEK